MEEYNVQRAKKRNSNAPSREEIKERVVQGIARSEGVQQAHIEKRKGKEESDREKEILRSAKRNKAMAEAGDREREVLRAAKKNKPHGSQKGSGGGGSANGVQNGQNGHMLTSQSSPTISGKQTDFPPNNSQYPPPKSVPKGMKPSLIDEDDGYSGDDNRDNARVIAGRKQKSSNGQNRENVQNRQNGREGRVGREGRDGDDGRDNREGRVSPRGKPGPQGMKRIAEEESDLYSERESVSINHKKALESSIQPMIDVESPSSLNLSDFSRRDNSISKFSPISVDSDNSLYRKTKDGSGSGEVTEKSKNLSINKKKSKKDRDKGERDKEKEKEDMINDFNFTFDNTAEPSLIDDLDDSLLAKKNLKNAKNDSLGHKKIRFMSKDGGSREGSKNDFALRDSHRENQLRDSQQGAGMQGMHGLVGQQWVSEVLESDENELGLLMMYSEGFSMFMAEEGIILESSTATVW